MKLKNKGFTLVELAIVLVIIGLILGAVLKGNSLIDNAKVKSLYKSNYQDIITAVYAYYDRYGRYPGDTNNNGTIDELITDCPSQSTSESCKAWEQLRLANFITGTDTTSPNNVFSGKVGIGKATVNETTATWIALTNIPGEVCQILDTQYDDGVYNAGNIQTTTDYKSNLSDRYTIYINTHI